MRRILSVSLAALLLPLAPPAQRPAAGQVEGGHTAPAPAEPEAALTAAERDTLLRLAWKTLEGHLTGHPIRNDDLAVFPFTPRLLEPRGCFVTLEVDDRVHGRQGDLASDRPLYQQVMIHVRRAATRDPRFVPLSLHDLDRITLRIDVITGLREMAGPEGIDPGRHGVYLEKWGRSAILLPISLAGRGWDAGRTLEELARLAGLPKKAWTEGARFGVFGTDSFGGTRPVPWSPDVWSGAPAEKPGARGDVRTRRPRG